MHGSAGNFVRSAPGQTVHLTFCELFCNPSQLQVTWRRSGRSAGRSSSWWGRRSWRSQYTRDIRNAGALSEDNAPSSSTIRAITGLTLPDVHSSRKIEAPFSLNREPVAGHCQCSLLSVIPGLFEDPPQGGPSSSGIVGAQELSGQMGQAASAGLPALGILTLASSWRRPLRPRRKPGPSSQSWHFPVGPLAEPPGAARLT